jgi:integrin beta 3
MDRADITALAEGMVPFVREVVADGTASLAARLAELEARQIEKGDRGPAGPEGEKGKRGEKGEQGRDGRDAADLALLKNWITEQAAEFVAMHLGAISITSPDNGRTLVFALGDKTCEIKTAIPIDAGVWVERTYDAGDAVSHGGSLWVAQQDTDTKPDTAGSHWRLAVKRGRDGRDYRAEEKRQPELARLK